MEQLGWVYFSQGKSSHFFERDSKCKNVGTVSPISSSFVEELLYLTAVFSLTLLLELFVPENVVNHLLFWPTSLLQVSD